MTDRVARLPRRQRQPRRKGITCLVVTGSRHWPQKFASVIHMALNERLAQLPEGNTLEVLDGACPVGGADDIAHQWACDCRDRDLPVIPRRIPADWSRGYRAGPDRNEELVCRGDLIEAFPYGRSVGTVNCLLYGRVYQVPSWVTTVWGDGSITRMLLNEYTFDDVERVHGKWRNQ